MTFETTRLLNVTDILSKSVKTMLKFACCGINIFTQSNFQVHSLGCGKSFSLYDALLFSGEEYICDTRDEI